MFLTLLFCFIFAALYRHPRCRITAGALLVAHVISIPAVTVDSSLYYAYMALCDLFSVVLICSTAKRLRVQHVVVAGLGCLSILINGLGWIMYESYIEPTVYNIAALSVIIAQIGSIWIMRNGLGLADLWHTVFRRSAGLGLQPRHQENRK